MRSILRYKPAVLPILDRLITFLLQSYKRQFMMRLRAPGCVSTRTRQGGDPSETKANIPVLLNLPKCPLVLGLATTHSRGLRDGPSTPSPLLYSHDTPVHLSLSPSPQHPVMALFLTKLIGSLMSRTVYTVASLFTWA